MNKVINFTRHNATKDQLEDNVIEPTIEEKNKIVDLITFEELPSKEDIKKRVKKTIEFAKKLAEKYQTRYFMIGGAQYYISLLEKEMFKEGLIPVYSFSKRVVEEVVNEDGKVVKKTIKFRHLGWIKGVLNDK